jgi:hypothetical protein
MRTTRFFASAASVAAAATFGLAAPASADVTQDGLVNVNVSDLNVQVPVDVAATICDVNVAVLTQDLIDDAAPCNAAGDGDARITTADSGDTTQEGLVNVNLTGVNVQIPVNVAATVCDVDVAVLTGLVLGDAAPCTADADGDAVITPAL